MLKISLSIDKRFAAVTSSYSSRRSVAPAMPRRVISLSVTLPITLKAIRIASLSARRTLGWSIFVLVLLAFAAAIHLSSGEAFTKQIWQKTSCAFQNFPLMVGSQSSHTNACYVSDEPPACIKDDLELCSTSTQPQKQPENIWFAISIWLTSNLAIAGLLFVLLTCIGVRKKLMTVHLILLSPYEDFPSIPQDIQLAEHDYVYAVRLLSHGADQRYSKPLIENVINGNGIRPQFAEFTSLEVLGTNDQDRLRLRHWPMHSYSSLVRFALIDNLLPSTGLTSPSDTKKALYFTFKQHVWTLFVYAALLAFAIGWPLVMRTEAKTEVWAYTQFSLAMAGLGIAWAVVATLLHRAKVKQLDKWDFMSLGAPFNSCPVFSYSKTASAAEHWSLIHHKFFGSRIARFGVDHNTFQQWVLAGFLIAYLAVLQLIK